MSNKDSELTKVCEGQKRGIIRVSSPLMIISLAMDCVTFDAFILHFSQIEKKRLKLEMTFCPLRTCWPITGLDCGVH